MRTRSVLVAAVLAAAVLAGCSSPGPAADLVHHTDVRELATAVAAQQRADSTARYTLRGDLTSVRDPEARLRFTGVGSVQITDATVELQFTQVVTGGGTPQETAYVVQPDAFYLRLPVEPGDEPDRPWVQVDPASTNPADQQLIATAATVTERADPTATLLRYAAATTISESGDDVIEGDPAVRYTLVTDLARAAEAETDEAVRAQLQGQVDAGLTTVSSELWVDGSNRPLRSAARQELPGIGTLAVTSAYRDWGQEHDITPPPEAEIRAAS